MHEYLLNISCSKMLIKRMLTNLTQMGYVNNYDKNRYLGKQIESSCTLKHRLSYNTPYNRLLRRQITASMTDQGKFCRKGVCEVFLFAKINKRICGLQLMIEDIFNVWRYYISNLTLFQVQISFLSARQNLRFKKIA